jgi:hypothetical protein
LVAICQFVQVQYTEVAESVGQGPGGKVANKDERAYIDVLFFSDRRTSNSASSLHPQSDRMCRRLLTSRSKRPDDAVSLRTDSRIHYLQFKFLPKPAGPPHSGTCSLQLVATEQPLAGHVRYEASPTICLGEHATAGQGLLGNLLGEN